MFAMMVFDFIYRIGQPPSELLHVQINLNNTVLESKKPFHL
jgi:hypothetical protein